MSLMKEYVIKHVYVSDLKSYTLYGLAALEETSPDRRRDMVELFEGVGQMLQPPNSLRFSPPEVLKMKYDEMSPTVQKARTDPHSISEAERQKVYALGREMLHILDVMVE